MSAGRRVSGVVLLLAALGAAGAAEGKTRHRKAPEPQKLDAAAVNAADVGGSTASTAKGSAPSPLFAKSQILLDRAHFSPGAIDGRDGDTFKGALDAFAKSQSIKADGKLTPELWAKLTAASGDPAVIDYTVTDADAKERFVEAIPPKMEDQASLDRLGYKSASEMLAERFHMSEALLKALNPGKPFDQAGTVLSVANVPPMTLGRETAAAKETKVHRIEVDKGAHRLQAFDKDDKLVAVYPASIGSTEKPAPSGTLTVKGVAMNPVYTYNPKYAFKGVKAKKTFSIKAGPNNPVGVAWIDLSADSYGIHGTAEPEKVGKVASHGCVRLTNWDVRQLASMVERGAKVEFKD